MPAGSAVQEELSADDKGLVKEVTAKFEEAEKQHKQHRRQWERWYSMYRSCPEWSHVAPQDRGIDPGLMGDLQSTFGQDLIVPVGFWTIETVLPRMLSQSPRMLVLPRDSDAEQNVTNMKVQVEAQQQRIDYELVLQDVGKDGLMYGLGVQKTFWRHEKAKRLKLVPATLPVEGQEFVEREVEVVTFDDPDAEAVDPFDWFWDPLGYDMRTVAYVIHRTWRSTEYVLDRMKQGKWRQYDPDRVKRLGPRTGEYDSVWRGRMKAAGHSSPEQRGEQVHEVWEFHDRKRVITILDRELPVNVADNPAWHGELPFQIFRPTRLTKHMVGIGELEPLEYLAHEMNTMRTQRRNNAALAVQRPFAFQDGLIDPADLRFGPGLAIPVQGDPREVLFPIPIQDVPQSSYMEEQSLLGDINRTSGISDSVAGGEGAGGTSETATGAQLVHAAANVRIQNKTKMLEKEVIRHAARQFVLLNQQRIIDAASRPSEAFPADPENPDPQKRWTWRRLGPRELMGEFEIVPEGGSTAPDNVPQMRQDAQMGLALFGGNPMVDQRRLFDWALRSFGVEHPESWLAAPGQLPPAVLDYVKQALVSQGIPQEGAQQLIGGALEKALSEQGANGNQPQQQGVQ